MIHLSTDFVFDGMASTPRQPHDSVNPLSVYGSTKLEGERNVAENSRDALIVRTAWVYSAAGRNFMLSMLRLMNERDRINVVSDQVGTPTSARSLAMALWRLVQIGATGVHHYTDAGVCSWYDFAVAIYEEAVAIGLLNGDCMVVPIRTCEYPTPARRPAYSVLDKSSTWKLLGAPASHWRVNLRACLREVQRTRSAA
jgi:dTDP-4-dehydrorhamnose reductase